MGKTGRISSSELQKKVEEARLIQRKRFFHEEHISFNSQMGPTEITKYCFLGQKEEEFMKKIFSLKNLSMRTYHKILKVARTIADLEGEKDIGIMHLSEAVSYRVVEEKLY